jgi:hypothetical protein
MKGESHTNDAGGKPLKARSSFRKVKIVKRFKVGGRTYIERSPFTKNETPRVVQRKQKKAARRLRSRVAGWDRLLSSRPINRQAAKGLK